MISRRSKWKEAKKHGETIRTRCQARRGCRANHRRSTWCSNSCGASQGCSRKCTGTIWQNQKDQARRRRLRQACGAENCGPGITHDLCARFLAASKKSQRRNRPHHSGTARRCRRSYPPGTEVMPPGPPSAEDVSPREQPPPGKERPERRGATATAPPTPREEEPPLGEKRPGRR